MHACECVVRLLKPLPGLFVHSFFKSAWYAPGTEKPIMKVSSGQDPHLVRVGTCVQSHLFPHGAPLVSPMVPHGAPLVSPMVPHGAPLVPPGVPLGVPCQVGSKLREALKSAREAGEQRLYQDQKRVRTRCRSGVADFYTL